MEVAMVKWDTLVTVKMRFSSDSTAKFGLTCNFRLDSH